MYVTRGLGKELTYDDRSTCDVTFFVPCYNEEKNIIPTLECIRGAVSKFNYTYQILIVDDGSKDRTKDLIEEFKVKNPGMQIDLIRNVSNRGLGRNYVDGAYLASGRYYMLVNGDNAEPAEAIEAIIAKLGQADMVIPHFGRGDNRDAGRAKLSLFFTWMVNKISSNTIQYYNGPVLHRRVNIIRWHSDTYGYAYQAEIITRLIEEGANFVEVLIQNLPRREGISKAFRMVNVLSVLHSLSQITLRRVRMELFKPSAPKGT